MIVKNKLKEKNFEEVLKSWATGIMRYNLLLILVNFIYEFIMFFINYIKDNLWCSVNDYFKLYLVKPGLINIAIFITAMIIIKLTKKRIKNPTIIPLLVMSSYVFNVSLIHYMFPTILLLYIVPIFFTTVYASKRTTLFIAGVNIIFLMLHFIIIYLNTDNPVINFSYFNCYVLSLLVLFSSISISCNIINYEQKKAIVYKRELKEKYNLQEKLLHDPLTGLYNHNGLFNRVEELVESGNQLHISMLDLDHFKKVNDTYGHETGNIVLIKLAEIINKHVNKNIFAGRYGGEEFSIVFANMDRKEAYNILNSIRKEFGKFKFKEMDGGHVTFSAGIVECREGNIAGTLFENADEALYSSKSNGRNKITIYKDK